MLSWAPPKVLWAPPTKVGTGITVVSLNALLCLPNIRMRCKEIDGDVLLCLYQAAAFGSHRRVRVVPRYL